jgi:phage terminase small subunit
MKPNKVQYDKFIAEYMKHGNATRAAIAIGFPESRAKQKGHELKNAPYVKEKIDQNRKEIAAKGIYNLEMAMKEADDAIQFAIETGNANAYVKAIEHKSKLNGLLIERQEIRTASFSIMIDLGEEPKPPAIDVPSSDEGEDLFG